MATINGITPMTLEQFFAIPNGTKVFNYGNSQCVALANQYDEGVLQNPLPTGIQSAFQWWTQYGTQPNLNQQFVQVSSAPIKGDIFVGRGGSYDSTHGHIGVVARDWDGSTFGTMEQGVWSGYNGYVTRLNRNMANILGFLRPIENVNHDGDDEVPSSQYFIASSNNASGTVKQGDVWVRGFPGAPLTALTAGQAHDWFALQKLDYNAPGVYSKPGSWFDLAFAEDNTSAALTKKVHS